MFNVVNTLAPSLIKSSSFLQVMWTIITSRTTSKFGQIGQWTVELVAIERLENPHRLKMEKNVVNTLAPTFLIQLSSFLQVTRICMKA